MARTLLDAEKAAEIFYKEKVEPIEIIIDEEIDAGVFDGEKVIITSEKIGSMWFELGFDTQNRVLEKLRGLYPDWIITPRRPNTGDITLTPKQQGSK